MKSTGSLLVLSFFINLVEKRDPFENTVKAKIIVNESVYEKALDVNLI